MKCLFEETYLLTVAGIKQYPAQLDNLCRIFGHVDAMLVTRGRNMNDEVPLATSALR